MEKFRDFVRIASAIGIGLLILKDIILGGDMPYSDLEFIIKLLVCFVFFGEKQWTTN